MNCHKLPNSIVLVSKGFMRFIFMIIILGSNAYAHPVTFKDGQEINLSSSPLMSKINYHYSLTARESLGFSILTMDNKYYLGEYNYLLIRKNTRESQSNIYLGITTGLSDQENLVLGGNIEADAETRRWYSMGKITIVNQEIMAIAKVGVAPVLSNYDQVQPWILLQYQKNEKKDSLGPVLRIMYLNYLTEISFIENNVYGSLMIHF